MIEIIFFILFTIGSIWLIKKGANYILEMELNVGLTLSFIILSAIVIFIGSLTSLFFIIEYIDPDPNYCEFCEKGGKI